MITKEEIIEILENASSNSMNDCECSKIEHRYIHNVNFKNVADEILNKTKHNDNSRK